MYEFRNQPFKTLYLVYALLDLLAVRIPYWTVTSLASSLRPRKTYTFKKAFMVNLVRFYSQTNGKVNGLRKGPTHRKLDNSNGVMGVWVEPFPTLVVNDVEKWAQNARVKPIRVPGYWIHKTGSTATMGQKPGSANEKVVYFLHGGAYIGLSAHPESPPSAIARGLLKHCKEVERTFAIEYRLSSRKPLAEENPFPAALLDAVMGYNYLINVVGYSPNQVIVTGDSAGGNLALALARYLVENANALPTLAPPGSLLLLSPWVFLGPSELRPGTSTIDNAPSDFLTPPLRKGVLGWANLALLGPLEGKETSTNPYISPASPSLSGIFTRSYPRSLVVGGDAELILDQIRVLQERMKEEVGEDKVQYYESKDSVHDFLVFSWHEPQRSETFRVISKWVTGLAGNEVGPKL